MSAFDADLVLANLLAAGTEDRVKARAAFEVLARLEPDNLRLLESRAMFEVRSGRTPEARGYFARAVELGSTDAQTYRNYATLVGASDPGLAEQLWRTAVSLQPADVPTRVNLGLLLAAHDPAGVLAVLEPVTGPNPPRAYDVFQLRTNAYVALNQLELARDSVRELVRVAAGRQQPTAANLLALVEKSLAAQTNAQR
jgi:tetratricopeptide (TPR) repeat protein